MSDVRFFEAQAAQVMDIALFFRGEHKLLPNYKDIPADEFTIVPSLEQFLADDDYYVILAVTPQAQIIGCLIGALNYSWFGSSCDAIEVSFVIGHEYRQYSTFCTFIELFEVWAFQSGADTVSLGASAMNRDYSKLYSRLGYAPATQIFTKRKED